MVNKTITLRKISTGGLLILEAKSFKDIIKSRNLNPSEWEEVSAEPESEVEPLGDNQGDGRPEDN